MSVRKKRARFSDIELQIIEESLKRNISPPEIAESLGRDLPTVRKKIWQMGWKSTYAIERKKLAAEERQIIKDRAKAREQEEEKAAKGMRMSIHPYLGAEWQEILVATGTRLTEWKGQRTLVMDGRPTTVHAIREKYARLIAEKDLQAASAAESPDQASHQSTGKAAQLQCNR